MNIFDDFQERIAAHLSRIIASGRLPADLDLKRFAVEPPRDPTHGDLTVNAALVYAKEAQASFANPRQLAAELAAVLAHDPDVAKAEVAGPGFLNIRLKPGIWGQVLRSVLTEGAAFGVPGRLPPEPERKVNVGYVLTNPAGPLHAAHCRGAVYSDALASLLRFAGYAVTCDCSIKDSRGQIDVLARSIYQRYSEALGETIGDIPEGLYPGDYVVPAAQYLAETYGTSLLGRPEAEWLETVRAVSIDWMMAIIREDLASLNIKYEVFFWAPSLTGGGNRDGLALAIDDLRAKGLLYEGRLPPPNGQIPEEREEGEQTLFESTSYGDDVDRVLLKSDGTYTYFASDIAIYKTKIGRGFSRLIDILDTDHGGSVKPMQAAVLALSEGKTRLDIKLCQPVKLMRNGEPVKTPKDSGDFLTLRDAVNEAGASAVRFIMLFCKNDAALDFDLVKAAEQSKDNAVFSVQYAYARGRSVLRQAAIAFNESDLTVEALAGADLTLLQDEGELILIKLIGQYPRAIEAAAAAHEPHKIAFYLHDLASLLHSQWTCGKDQPQLRFVNEDRSNLTFARLALVTALTSVLASGLNILGVGAPEEMR